VMGICPKELVLARIFSLHDSQGFYYRDATVAERL
jgi:hypothetical protein